MSCTYGGDTRACHTLIRQIVIMGTLGFVHLYLSITLMLCAVFSPSSTDDDDVFKYITKLLLVEIKNTYQVIKKLIF